MADPEVKVRLTAQDGTGPALDGLRSRLKLVREVSEDAGRGMGRIGNALGDMAREAVGASGPLGRVAEKLLEFGIGSGLFVAVAAGLAAIFGLFKQFKDDADALHTSLGKVQQSLAELNNVTAEAHYNKATADFLAAAQDLDFANTHFWRSSTAALAKYNEALADLLLATKEMQGVKDAERAKEEAAAKAASKKADHVTQEVDAMTDLLAIEKRAAEQFLKNDAAKRTPHGTGAIAQPDLSGVLATANEIAPEALFTKADPFAVPSQGALEFKLALQELPDTIEAVSAAMQGIAQSFLGSVPGFGAVAKAAGAAIRVIAKVEGTYHVLAGAAKIAKSLFPPNPAGIASGSGEVAQGAKLLSLGGSGGGASSGSTSGSGALSSGGFNQSQRDSAAAQGTTTIVFKGNTWTGDPEFQDQLAKAIGQSLGRRVVLEVS